MIINYDSVKTICGKAEQAMIYGWHHCKYTELFAVLQQEQSTLKKVFNWTIALTQLHGENLIHETLEGRKIKQFEYNEDSLNGEYKVGITNLIWENYLRHIEGKSLIPLIFCIDIDKNPYPTTLVNIASKEEELNEYSTHSELRRCYKFCCELDENPDLKKISDIARVCIKFVKLRGEEAGQGSIYHLEEISPFWQNPEWNQKWKERKVNREVSSSKPHYWKEQLKNLMHSV